MNVSGWRWLWSREARVARAAARIRDPLARLRYLKAAATEHRQPPAPVRFRLWMIWAACLPLILMPFLLKLAAGKPEPFRPPPIPASAAPSRDSTPIPVWRVEQSADSEVYSNGLRIDTRFTVTGSPRTYLAFRRDSPGRVTPVRRADPAGIVFHTTESCQAPFQEDETPALKRLGESLLAYVCRKQAYHYLIDRFGRVFSIVEDSGIANHAGYSVWADAQWFYINLNESFLGISFEAQTDPAEAAPSVSPGQVRAAAMLTEMLRSRYHIAAENCVTHAQVSVNPANMLIGYHTDWATGFPFADLGLPDNDRRPLPALWAFGFACEPAWIASKGSGLAEAVKIAEEDLKRGAASAGMRPVAYRHALRGQYKRWLADVRRTSSVTPQVRSGSGSAGR